MRMRYCTADVLEEVELLREMAGGAQRSIEEIAQRIHEYDVMRRRAEEVAAERLQEVDEEKERRREELKEYDEEVSYTVIDKIMEGASVEELVEGIREDRERRKREKRITSLIWDYGIKREDVERVLKDLEEKGYIRIEGDIVSITPKGARKLARRIVKDALERRSGVFGAVGMPTPPGRHGSKLSTSLRPYEFGDDYELVSIEETLLNAMHRDFSLRELREEDFIVHKTSHKRKVFAGLIIDKSGSMNYNRKMMAAIEASLALSELMRKHSDTLKIFVFSEFATEIPAWELVRMRAGGNTGMAEGMSAFRRAAHRESGEKHAYLLTDSEPNTEDGVYVGFRRAVKGVLREASKYRDENISLDIIMLDDKPHLRRLARMLARESLGRVFFAKPENLAAFVVEDYLRRRLA
ncbi:hypothetical protein [Candidatus Alkanophaga liquidiphilum]|nr:Protein containing von Willebrand factor type A domain [Candidatus Alkanophaga liquidiphilum]